MKIFYAAAAAIAISLTASSVSANTASATIRENAAIVPGNTVSAYLIGGHVVTATSGEGAPHSATLGAAVPAVRIGFDAPAWHLVKHVTWDKPAHRLTIDF